jgi:Protein of unknown function (DUF1592)/Protein of unknown function (DUF1588)/Protein of unknown function (DUF1587)/Protein of unknown function (DUF1595)/Protein of unknown function (DUF1585)
MRGVFVVVVLVGFIISGPLARAEDGSFARSVYPVLEKAGCSGCHNNNGVASATRLHFPDQNATPEKLNAFGKSLAILVDSEHPENSLLFRKPTQRVTHGGGERIKVGSPEEAIWLSWVQVLAHLSKDELAAALKYNGSAVDQAGVLAPTLRRLTHSQYNNTVRDLLGDRTSPADQFPQEDFVNGFKNQYEAQNISPLLEEAYANAAERLAANAFRNGDQNHLIPCTASVQCRSMFVREFGKKAFRRPLDDQEVQRYVALLGREHDFLKGAQLVVEAMLESPNFLFRMDTAPNTALAPYATASRLSYTLWDTQPDDALLAAAARGELATPQGLDKVASAMLHDPRAHQALNEFVSEWLRFDRILTATRDRRTYPQYTRETAVAMTQEAQLFIGDLVWNNRNFMDAFTADYGFVNADLALIYGVPAPAREFDRVPFPAASERAGLLGQSLFLALTSKPEDASLTGRGLFVREQFLCQHVPPPPPGVNTNLPASTEAHPQTNRERMSEHATNPTCASCHRLIDPIGAGLEKFDAIGMRREEFKLKFYSATHGDGEHRSPPKSVLLPIDTKGSVVGIPQSDFSSPRELGIVLAAAPQCQKCVVKQYFRYVMGREETSADGPTIERIFEDFKKSNFHFQDLILSIVRAREFPSEERDTRVARNH